MNNKSPVHYRPADSPLVLSMPHSGILYKKNELPDPINRNMDLSDPKIIETINKGVDRAVPYMTDFFSQNGLHHLVWTTHPRVLTDVNRAEKETDNLSVEGRGEPAHAHGLIWRSTAETVEDIRNASSAKIKKILERPYTAEEFNKILDFAYRPYIENCRLALKKALEDHSFSIMLDLHSIPGHAAAKMQEGEHRGAYILGQQKAKRGPLENVMKGEMPDIILITDPDENGQSQACHPKIQQTIKKTFEEDGLIVSDGFGPFQGNNGSVAMYSDPKNSRHVARIEHVTHDIETGRTAGILEINMTKALAMRKTYQKLFERLSRLSAKDIA